MLGTPPWPASLRRRRLRTVSLRTPAARRAHPLQGALDLGNQSDRHATVAGCRLGLGMSEQRLNHANVLAALEQMCRKAVSLIPLTELATQLCHPPARREN